MAGADRRALQTELIRALADGPGVVVFEGAFDHDVVDRASEAFTALIDAQRAAGRRRGRPLRQGRRQRPHLERRAEARAARSRGLRRVLRQRRPRHGVRRPGWARATRSPHRSTSSIPVAHAQVPHRDYHLGFVDDDQLAALSRAHAPHVGGADAAGRRRALRHAAGERADDAAALLAEVRRRVHRVLPARSSSTTSPTSRCRCRCARATRCSSTPRSCTGRAPTRRPTSAGWPTCCRSRRRSGGRWSRWTAPRWCGPSTRPCWR